MSLFLFPLLFPSLLWQHMNNKKHDFDVPKLKWGVGGWTRLNRFQEICLVTLNIVKFMSEQTKADFFPEVFFSGYFMFTDDAVNLVDPHDDGGG